MLKTAAGIVGPEHAEEVLHDAFVRLIEKFQKNFSELRDKPAAYFVIVSKNCSINFLRNERETFPLEDSSIFVDSRDGPEAQAISKDKELELASLISSLSPNMREIIEYKYILEYSNKELSKILHISESAVSSRIDRAKKALLKKFEENGGYDI